ncbi:endonuclease/exonuclease/phosphatase family protein [Salegentibacter mishustinae]|uniref:Endonuclease n=1 Tax=Salegentibacter mishustinae TaxID=270918 RepID=A0A0Q9Z897_9FLAO|nr:endonuclease/exonuclease/phosphatase family protein [Salegentibacter mishustinae]KRG29195.1 endonuclease [Salegentibacter mishustinae]PNW21754.1 endonuclease [Salegentibacter mishustinae]PZX65096.1 endonuclease/exonuclease/phosphatase (EEP) superfamily protein YafD [Salegentibacter mishustinae]GGW87353.1 endonuclease [Salegentibacter mishustinae]
MEISEVIMLIACGLFLIPSLASATRFDQWWIRAFDFPRLQISILISAVIIVAIIVFDFSKVIHFVAVALLIISLIYQLEKIYPYTWFANKEVMQFEDGDPSDNISILVSNVLTPNNDYHKLLEIVNRRQPDILLTLESDEKWEEALKDLEKDYEYCIKVPQDNLYGMHLYSKLKLEETEIRYLVKDDIPSIHGVVRLEDNSRIRIHCMHPRPPSPSEADTSTNRDAELLMLGRDVWEQDDSVLVFGDLNDVAWSRTTRLFQQMSGLLDPRIGRGFFNTFHADYRFFRWPLDHVFHSNDFTLIDIAREKHIGSDHFPMYIKLNFERKAEVEQNKPIADEEEKEWAQDKIDDAQPREKGV